MKLESNYVVASDASVSSDIPSYQIVGPDAQAIGIGLIARASANVDPGSDFAVESFYRLSTALVEGRIPADCVDRVLPLVDDDRPVEVNQRLRLLTRRLIEGYITADQFATENRSMSTIHPDSTRILSSGGMLLDAHQKERASLRVDEVDIDELRDELGEKDKDVVLPSDINAVTYQYQMEGDFYRKPVNDGANTVYGHYENEQFVPFVTVLNDNHPVRQAP